MRRAIFPALLPILLGVLAAGQAVHADSGNTLQDELRVFTEENAAQCKSVKEQLEAFNVKADPLTGYNLMDAVQSLCVCLPGKTGKLKGTLGPEDLAREVTDEEFLRLLNPAVTDLCAGEQLKSMYGEQCRKRFKRPGLDVRHYCACMQTSIRSFSDADAAALADASANYLPLAAEAEKKGDPAPPVPLVLQSYYAADLACKAKVR